MQITVIKLNSEHTKLLENFCNECAEHGYDNNASLEKMKFNDFYDLGEIPTFFAVVVNNEIAAVAGSHSLAKDSLRCGFRGASLPRFSGIIKGLSKTHMTNLAWAPLMPEIILDGLERNFGNFYITTSHTAHDASGKMQNTHRAMQLLAKQGILQFQGINEIYHVPQTVWKFNLSKFFKTVKAFDPVREKLGIKQYRYNSELEKIKKLLYE